MTMSKLLVIGLDGGSFDILLPLVDQNQLPHIASLLREGSWGRLESTIPPFTAAAWSTIATGRNPGQHGILSFEKRDPYEYHSQLKGYVDGRQLTETLWEIISRAGKRVIVVNVPVTYPPRPVNGLMVTGMMTPSNAAHFTYPPELAAELTDYRIDVDFIRAGDEFRKYRLPSKREMLAEIQAVTTTRSQTCLRLISEQSWDFFMTVYTGTDRLCHFFWDDLTHLLLTNTPEQVDPQIRAGLLAYFKQLDADIGALTAAAGPDATVMLMSDHGFGPSPTKRFYVNLWLEQLGLLQPKQLQSKASLAYWRRRVGRNIWLKRLYRRLLSAEAQEQLSKSMQKEGVNSDIEWNDTRAYYVPIYFHVCGIEINTSGKHRAGIVATEAEYEMLRDHLLAAAIALHDPQTSRPIVQQAYRRESLYTGPYAEQFPDIILVLDPDYIGMRSLAGSQLVESHEPFRPGEHRADGIFGVKGPDIGVQGDLPDLRLTDLPATILYLMDLPVPVSFDGRILSEIIKPATWQTNPPQSQSAVESQSGAAGDSGYSAEEEVELEQRLRSLGYLE